MPSRVSSATQRAHAARALGVVGLADRLARPRPVGLAEQAALLERVVEHALQARGRVGDDLLGVLEAAGLGQRRDGGVDLLGGVGALGHVVRDHIPRWPSP